LGKPIWKCSFTYEN